MTDAVISIDAVTRRFGKHVAVDGVTLDVPAGSIFGLLGANGAGKTTLIRMLVGHLHVDAGSIQIMGQDPWTHTSATLQRIAYVSDSMQLPSRMTLGQVLKLNAGFFPKWDSKLAETLLGRFELPTDRRYATFSLGQKRRAVLLQALCQGADLLILDEPASGLDPLGRRQFLDVLLEASVDRGQTVLFSSHVLSDVERVVDRIAIMSHGRVMTTGNLEDLKHSIRRVRIAGPVERSQLASHFEILDHRVRGETTEVLVTEFDESAWDTFQESQGQDALAEQLNLEDMFVELSSGQQTGGVR